MTFSQSRKTKPKQTQSNPISKPHLSKIDRIKLIFSFDFQVWFVKLNAKVGFSRKVAHIDHLCPRNLYRQPRVQAKNWFCNCLGSRLAGSLSR